VRALEPFRPADAALVAGWVTSPEEASRWASMASLPDAATFARWHADPDVVPFVVREDGEPVAYGEIWLDADEDEAELARLLVAPDARGRGLGRCLARALADEAHGRGFADVWLRVVPDNEAALRAYAAAGFVRATVDQERAFDAGQPVAYRWLRDGTGTAADVTGRQPGRA
jgi:RimJ/RimL family protein N-acetyltransferase